MKRHLLGLALGSLASLVLVGGFQAARAQDYCPTGDCVAAPEPGHPMLSRFHQLIHTPALTYRPTHYMDWFWVRAGHAQADRRLVFGRNQPAPPPAPAPTGPVQGPFAVGPDRPVPGFLRHFSPPNPSKVNAVYQTEGFAGSAPTGPTRPNR